MNTWTDKEPMKHGLLLAGLAIFTVVVAVSVADSRGVIHLPAISLLLARCAAIAVLFTYGIRRRSLTTWILICMVIGGELGHDFPGIAVNLRVLSLIFLRMIKTIIAPLLFGTLVVGIAGHSNLRQVGRMGLKALIYFEVVTTLALFIGLAAINLSKAGVGVNLAPPAQTEQLAATKETATDVILHIFPENIAKSVAEGQVLQVVIFSILFAIALALISEEKRRPMLAFAESLSETMFKFTNIVMLFAPIGVGAAIAYTVASTGFAVFGSLLKLLLTYYATIVVFVSGVLLPIALMARVPVRKFARAIAEPVS